MSENTKPRILLVEDDEITAEQYSEYLSDIAQVEIAERVDQVFEQLLQPVDLIVLDIHLREERVYEPTHAGVRILERIREQLPPFRDIPVLVVTASIEPEVEAECRKLGAVGFLHKPVTLPIVSQNVSEILRNQRARPPRIKVFVSSTMRDLQAERQTVKRAILELGPRYSVELAEDCRARSQAPRQICHEAVRACDVLILLIGERYGEAIVEGNISATEDEYNVARKLVKPVLVFALKTNKREALERAFLTSVGQFATGHWIKEFRDLDQLYVEVQEAMKGMAKAPAL